MVASSPGLTPLLLLVVLASTIVSSRMVMDESSCHQVEEEVCGLCHTLYMEECTMRQVEEMRPTKATMCRQREECTMERVVEEVEEERPVCKVKAMDKEHRPCSLEEKGCLRMVVCSMEKVMKKKENEKKVCNGRMKEQCFSVVKLEKVMKEKKDCSFQPKTMCHPSRMKDCRRRRRKMCNYLDSNTL